MSHIFLNGTTDEFTKSEITPMYTFDYLIFIGRFQPFHFAHMQTIEIALQQSQHVVLALGSAQSERNIKNPFLAHEREQMILSNFSEDDHEVFSNLQPSQFDAAHKFQVKLHNLIIMHKASLQMFDDICCLVNAYSLSLDQCTQNYNPENFSPKDGSEKSFASSLSNKP